MTLLQLRYFCMVAQFQSISQAARLLMVSQPALCKVIHSLEEELDVQLFTREGRSLLLNSKGRFFYDNIEHCLNILDSTVNALNNRSTVKEIRICVNSGDLFVEEAIAEYRQLHDDVFFVLSGEDKAGSPNNVSSYDLAVYTADRADFLPSSTRQHRLLTERFGVGIPACDPASQKSSISLRELSDRNFLGTSTYGLNFQMCKEAGFNPKMIIVGQQLHAYLKMLEYESGVSIMPEISLGAYIPSNCRFLYIEGSERTRTLVMEESVLLATDSHVHDFVRFCLEKAKRMEDAVRSRH